MTITGKWQGPAFTVPAGVHFTTFAGMVHHSKANLWQPGSLATLGVKNVAEVGNTVAINVEIDSMIASGPALERLAFSPPSATGQVTGSIRANSNFPQLSLASMIAPSPDWFIGLSSFSLYRDKQWVKDTTINLYVYDAGTEEGDVFGYSNPATVPQQPISLQTAARATVLANGNATLAPIATIRLKRQ